MFQEQTRQKPIIPKPKYTIRLLVNHSSSVGAELNRFSHCTLACTFLNLADDVATKLDELVDYFGDSVTFKAKDVVNLRSEAAPLWAVRLDLGEKEKDLRALFSKLFDNIMWPETNGVQYLWDSPSPITKKCPHITIGTRPEDQVKAQALVDRKYSFVFEQVDYKQIGEYDPHVTKSLVTPTISMRPQG